MRIRLFNCKLNSISLSTFSLLFSVQAGLAARKYELLQAMRGMESPVTSAMIENWKRTTEMRREILEKRKHASNME